MYLSQINGLRPDYMDTENTDTERSPLKWHIKRDGYPSNNNEVLEEYISQVTKLEHDNIQDIIYNLNII